MQSVNMLFCALTNSEFMNGLSWNHTQVLQRNVRVRYNLFQRQGPG
jgi:glucan phosphorylase